MKHERHLSEVIYSERCVVAHPHQPTSKIILGFVAKLQHLLHT